MNPGVLGSLMQTTKMNFNAEGIPVTRRRAKSCHIVQNLRITEPAADNPTSMRDRNNQNEFNARGLRVKRKNIKNKCLVTLFK